jgi:phytoene synthase
MARRLHDSGDGDASAPEKLAALAKVRKDLAGVASGGRSGEEDPVLIALTDVASRFPIPLSALDELVDGCEMDVHGTGYACFDELVGYCHRVAGSIGRLSLGIYGTTDVDRAEPLADALGVALQITNILRDILEDRDEMGRIYLPEDDRERFGVSPDLGGPLDGMLALISFEAARAEVWYEKGLALLPLLDWRSRACTAAMAGIYRRLLVRIQRDPASVLRGRVSLPTPEKLSVALRALLKGAA